MFKSKQERCHLPEVIHSILPDNLKPVDLSGVPFLMAKGNL